MTHRLLVGLAFSLGLALSACTPPSSEWSEVEAPKKLRVDYVRMEHIAAFSPGSNELGHAELDSLNGFLAKAEIGSTDRIYFQPASDDKLATQRIAKLSHSLARRGIGAETLPPGPVPANRMRVIVERYVVTPPDCPNWTEPPFAEHSNQPHANFGCAVNTNFALMVADPRDLVIGRTLAPAEGDAALLAIARYREGKTKGLITSGGAGPTLNINGPSGGGGSGSGQ